MNTQSCPRCGSNRIRQGYRRTPWWWAIFGRYNLLCDFCNWEYVGFAVPGIVSAHSRKRRKQEKELLYSKAAEKPFVPVAESNEVSQTVKLNESVEQEAALTVVDNLSANTDLQKNESSASFSAEFENFQFSSITQAASGDKLQFTDPASSDKNETVNRIANGGKPDRELRNDESPRPHVKKKKRARHKIKK